MKKQRIENNAEACRSDLKEEVGLLRLVAKKEMKRRNISTSGILLGTIARENSRETRYSWDCVNAHSYLRIQDFHHDVRDGSWAPVKGKCFSVRIHELALVKGFVQKAIDLVLVKAEGKDKASCMSDDDDVLIIEPLKRDLRDVK